MARVLVVDDEEGLRSFIAEVLTGEGHHVTEAVDGQEALELLQKHGFHLILTDLKMPRLEGMELLRHARAEQPEMEAIVLTAHGTVDTAVEAMKLGALDYLTKPLSGPDELRLVVARALERRQLRDAQLGGVGGGSAPETMIAEDPAMRAVLTQLRKVAPTEATVLLSGESGTGKELAARLLHHESKRRDRPFIAVNCAALSSGLLESEMFGHEKGAFTGATGRRRGRFELSDGGTLFLDEVGELALDLQAKLLRVLQERRLERVGGTRLLEVDVRVIAATNRELSEEMHAGRFREDLFHRLSVFPVRLPPLRERPADIEPLAAHLLQIIDAQVGKPGLRLSESTMRVLRAYAWPGNVRELSNVLERAAILAERFEIGPDDLLLSPVAITKPHGTLKEIEREAIRQALAETGGHRKHAAEKLGIAERTLYDKIKEYGL
jgi:two-component system response regulator FlrC